MRTDDWYTDRIKAYMLNYNPDVLDTILAAAKEENRSNAYYTQMFLKAAFSVGYDNGRRDGFAEGHHKGGVDATLVSGTQ